MEQIQNPEFAKLTQHLEEVQRLLSRHRLVENLVSRQEMPKHRLVENIVHKQNLGELGQLLNRLDAIDVARTLEALSPEDRLLAWEQIRPERLDGILLLLLDDVREELVNASTHHDEKHSLNVFELHEGRLRQVKVANRADLAGTNPIWVDLDEARSIAVAFILHKDVLFSVRRQELLVFRLQRLRARAEPGYVTEGKDVLLDLYAADAEYSADTLENVYAELEKISKRVLNPQVTDEEAAQILSEIARGEDLNGRVRRNALDTRRALSFLMRGRALSTRQHEEAREIVRDIESLDSHTTFLFGKINFLMDATVGFININQNKRVSKLTSMTFVFMPIAVLASIGGMSEYSMMAADLEITWPVAYVSFLLASAMIGWGTYHLLKFFESRATRQTLEAKGQTKLP